MKNRATFLLIILFFGGLVLLWALDRGGHKGEKTGQDRLLSALSDLEDDEIAAIEISGQSKSLRFERRGDDWQMVRPLDVLADRSKLNGLVATLRNLSARPEAGSVPGPAKDYGLDPPDRTITVFASKADAKPVQIKLGDVRRDFLYLQTNDDPTIHVAAATGLTATPTDAAAWRSLVIFPAPSHEVERMVFRKDGREFALEHGIGTWKIVAPFRAPAEDPKVEGLVDTVLGLRVADEQGFVTGDAADLKPFGLDSADSRIDVTTGQKHPVTRSLRLGKQIPGRPGFVYAIVEGQDDVVSVDRSGIPPFATLPLSLRNTEVADVDFDAATELHVKVGPRNYVLTRTDNGWTQGSPVKVAGDYRLILDYLAHLGGLHALKIMPESETKGTGLDRPSAVIQVWHGTPGDGPSDVTLKLGRFDPDAQVLYAQVEGEPNVLSLPATARSLILRGPLSLADRTVQRLTPGSIAQLTVRHGGRTVTIRASDGARDYEHWSMIEPVKAPVDVLAVSSLDAVLSKLRAEDLRPDASPAETGLDRPWLRIDWILRDKSAGSLTVGALVPDGKGARFAAPSMADAPFTLAESILAILGAELHERTVLTIPENTINSITVTRSGTSLRWRREARVFRQSNWIPEQGAGSGDVISPFASALAELQTTRFLQYEGPFEPRWGLAADPLEIRIQESSGGKPARLRVGAMTEDGQYAATTAEGQEGAVFLLPATLVGPLMPEPRLPADVFKAD